MLSFATVYGNEYTTGCIWWYNTSKVNWYIEINIGPPLEASRRKYFTRSLPSFSDGELN